VVLAIRTVADGTQVTESYDIRWIPAWARILDVPTNRYGALREPCTIGSDG
jgi:hypothetical protein